MFLVIFGCYGILNTLFDFVSVEVATIVKLHLSLNDR